jgi:hypothetical protein
MMIIKNERTLHKLSSPSYFSLLCIIQGPFERFVDWQQCTAVMQRVAVTIVPSCSGGGNVVVV